MDQATRQEIEALGAMTLSQLRAKYFEVFGEENNSKHKVYLAKRIAWGIQAKKSGGLSALAVEKIREYSDESLLRIRLPKGAFERIKQEVEGRCEVAANAPPELKPGAILSRTFKGTEHRVEVLATGFRYGEQTYRSLSAVARAITGTNWNGLLFFGLKKGAKA
jgi:hypothetical protein